MAQEVEMVEARLVLSPAERDALRRLGEAYVGVVHFFPKRTGRQVRPARTALWRTEAAAQKALNDLRFRNPEARREVVRVDARTEVV